VKYPEHFQGIDSLRKWKKTRRQMQFARDLPTFVSTADSRLHCVLGPEADTGRLSAKLPALQQIPSKNDQYGLRGAFRAGPGHSLVVSDFSQLEVYILAHMLVKLFGDHSLADALSGDVYMWIVRKVWPDLSKHWSDSDGKTKGHPAKAKRDLAKILVLATNYGKTATGLAMSLIDFELDGEPADEAFCEALLATYLSVLPGIPRWQEWIAAYARKNGGVPTVLGRWRPIPLARSERRYEAARGARQALNTPIQGSAADVTTCAMLGLNSYDGVPGWLNPAMRDLKADCIMQIHDELIFEVPSENAVEAMAIIEHGMVNPPELELAVKLKVEAAIGNSWKEAK
jgi:DNA polymerase-1